MMLGLRHSTSDILARASIVTFLLLRYSCCYLLYLTEFRGVQGSRNEYDVRHNKDSVGDSDTKKAVRNTTAVTVSSLVRVNEKEQTIRIEPTDNRLLVLPKNKATKHKFGHNVWKSEFLLNYSNFNHGSFGACPKKILDYQSSLRLQQEQQPDIWMRRHYKELMNTTRQKIAKYINVNVNELVLVESTSTAVNSLLRSFEWNSQQNQNSIAYFTTAYGMVKNTAKFLKQQQTSTGSRGGIEIVEIPVLGFPITSEVGDDAFLIPMKESLEQIRHHNNRTDQFCFRVVLLDHMVSCPGIKTPIRELASLIKEYCPHTFVLIDGAHALGQIQNLDLPTQFGSNIDAYISNGHKWFYTPKGSAFLWFKSSRVTTTFPEPTVISSANPITSSSLEDDNKHVVMTSFSKRFDYTSTRDYTALLSFDAAFDFRSDVLGGDAAIYDYVRSLALSARRYLLDAWNTTAVVPEYMEEFMINIGLPLDIAKDPSTKGVELQEYLLKHYNMYIVVIYNPTNCGFVYTRLSSQVYLELSDFVRLGDAVLEFVNKTKSTTTSAIIEDSSSSSSSLEGEKIK